MGSFLLICGAIGIQGANAAAQGPSLAMEPYIACQHRKGSPSGKYPPMGMCSPLNTPIRSALSVSGGGLNRQISHRSIRVLLSPGHHDFIPRSHIPVSSRGFRECLRLGCWPRSAGGFSRWHKRPLLTSGLCAGLKYHATCYKLVSQSAYM